MRRVSRYVFTLGVALCAAPGFAKDSVTIGMVLEPPGLDPTAGAASAIAEVTHYNIFEGLTKINEDFSIMKSFRITEKVSFGFRMDSTNFFNHTNLGGPDTNVQDPNVGQITSIAFGGNNGVGMRKLQFSGNIKF